MTVKSIMTSRIESPYILTCDEGSLRYHRNDYTFVNFGYRKMKNKTVESRNVSSSMLVLESSAVPEHWSCQSVLGRVYPEYESNFETETVVLYESL